MSVISTAIERMAARWRIARLLPLAGAPVVLGTVLANLLLGVLPVAFVVETSTLLGRVPAAVKGGVGSPAWGAVVSAFVLAALAFVGQQILAPVQTSLGELVARRVDGRIFDRLMAASLRSTSIAPLEDQELLDALGTASHELEFGFQSPGRAGAGLLSLLARVVQLYGYIALIGVAFSWWAAAGTLAAVLVFRHGQRGGLSRYAEVFVRIAAQRRKSRYYRELAIRGAAAKEIRVFGLLDWLRANYRESYLAWLMPVWSERRRILMRPFFWFTGFGMVALAVVLGAVGRAGGHGLTLTQLALVLQAVLAARWLGDYYPESDTQTQFGMNAYDAVVRFERGVDGYPAAAPGTGNAGPAPRTAVRFEGVAFGYPGQDRPVFDGLDLSIPAGRCTAIVGANGAGKTTLVKLLARLHEPASGRIEVDGVDIRQVPIADWRAGIAVIFQDYNRYEVSAADNIGFGAIGHLADRERIRAAAEAAGILAVLEDLPLGLDTPLARHLTDGAELSGGQWQRVALARALFAIDTGASILVLDEPTASLDVRAEARFFDEFVSLTRGVTTILISHRFSTVRHADHIVVLEGGAVVEQGTHDELVELGGRYAEMFRLQAARFIEAEEVAA